MSYTMKVNIEEAGTSYTYQQDIGDYQKGFTKESLAGHIWMSLTNNDTGETINYGYTLGNDRKFIFSTGFGDGKVIHDDDIAYAGEPKWSRGTTISNESAAKIINYWDNLEKNPGHYDAATNSCVDKVWQALNSAFPNLVNGFEGAAIPTNNIYDFNNLFDKLDKIFIPNETDSAETSDALGSDFGGSILPGQDTLIDYINNNPWLWANYDNVKGHAEIIEWKETDCSQKKMSGIVDDDTPDRTQDPLALDLDGDGKISTISLKDSRAYFDHSGDGIARKTSWIAPNDGLLVFDKNENGIIDNGNELFGDSTQIASADADAYAKDGYEALRALDSNNDGIISNLDDAFSKLKVWQDINSDGISQDSELKSLGELNIKSLDLKTIERNEDLGNGNFITLASSYTKTDGSKFLSADIVFQEGREYDKILNYANLNDFIFNLTDRLNKFGISNEAQSDGKDSLGEDIVPSKIVNKIIEDLNSYGVNDGFLSFVDTNTRNDTSVLQIYGVGVS